MRHLQSLTPLRGVAALAVLMLHLTRGNNDASVPAFFLRGYLGVDLFFVLSGFVLTHVYREDFLAGPSWRAVGAFLWARFARIYPVHIFIACVLVAAGAAHGLSRATVLANFLLILVPWPVVAINPFAWSLSAEWYAYLAFPLVVCWLWRCHRRIAAALCFALLLGLDALIVGHFGTLREIGSGWGALARALPEFAVGIITYRAFSDPAVARLWRTDAAFLAVVAAIALALGFAPSDGVVVALLPLLLLAAVSNTGIAARLLNAGPLRLMGDLSYSVYLGQALALTVVMSLSATSFAAPLGLNGLRVLAIVLALGIGWLLYRCIEVSCRTVLRRAPDQLRRLAARA